MLKHPRGQKNEFQEMKKHIIVGRKLLHGREKEKKKEKRPK